MGASADRGVRGWRRRTVLAAAGLALLRPAAAQDRGGVLVAGVIGDPASYDIHAGASAQMLTCLAPHYSLLVKWDPDRPERIAGDLAESWSIAEDARSATFRLHPAQFHDGSRVTARDVQASFERLRDPQGPSPRHALLADVAAIEAPDEATVTFRLRRPAPYLPAVLASPSCAVLSADALARDPAYPARRVMGSGPFRFGEHVAGMHWEGRRFDGYFRAGRPFLDGFRVVVLADGAAATAALAVGRIMAEFRGVAPADRNRLVQLLGDRATVQETTAAAALVLVFNAQRPPFDDARVRRALSLAIDRWTASRNLQGSVNLRQVGGTQRPGSPFAAADADLETMPGFGRDIGAARAEARRLLAEAGQASLSFRLTNRAATNPFGAAGAHLIDQWRQIGLTVEHQPLDTAAAGAALRSGNFEAILDLAGEAVDDPSVELVRYLSFDRNPANPARATDRDLDALYDRQRTIPAAAERIPLVRGFERRLFEQAWSVPVLWLHRITVHAQRVHGWTVAPTAAQGLDLADVWLAPP